MKKLLLSILVWVSCTSVGYGNYRIDRYTIDGGGGTMAGGAFRLTGAIGQADAGRAAGGGYELIGGFWAGGPECRVDLEFFAEFARHWLDSPCDAGNFWCGGADLNHVDDVNMDDFALLVGFWLAPCPYGD